MKSLIQKCDEGSQVHWSMQYAYNVGISVSQFFNVILFLGDPDETISGRTGKAANSGNKWCLYFQEPIINWLFQDENHCQDAIEPSEGGKQLWDWAK